MLEETDRMRRRRIAKSFTGWFLGIIFTLSLLTIDAIVVFTPELLIVDVPHPEMTISFGPLFTRLCTTNNNTDIPNEILSDVCIKILFYQLPIDDYIGPISWQSTTVMIAYWVPLVASLLCMRATFMLLHPYLQFICSAGYIGVIVIMFETIGEYSGNKYMYGIGLMLILIRIIICTVTMLVTTCVLIFRACMIKYDICGCGNDDPILVGVSYEDPSKQEFWSPMKQSNEIRVTRRSSYQSIDLGEPISVTMSDSI